MKTLGQTSAQVLRLLAAVVATAGSTEPLHAQDRPDFIAFAEEEAGGWWETEARALLDWRDGAPLMTGLECVANHNRYGRPPLQIAVTHPMESGDYRFRFQFALTDGELIDRQVETITVGGRPYQIKSVQSRIIPWIGGPGENDIVLTYGIGRDMFRPNEGYPWLPIEFLIPQFFEVEGIELGISGQFEIEHGEYERRYEEVYIDMDGFKEAMSWCYNHVNPDHEFEDELSTELRRRMAK